MLLLTLLSCPLATVFVVIMDGAVVIPVTIIGSVCSYSYSYSYVTYACSFHYSHALLRTFQAQPCVERNSLLLRATACGAGGRFCATGREIQG